MTSERISGLAHCCHHDKHWEYCYNYSDRVAYIKERKSTSEQELRLKLFKIVPDERLPGRDSPEFAAYKEAGEVYDREWTAYNKAWITYRKRAQAAYNQAAAAWEKVWAVYDGAQAAYNQALTAYIARYQDEFDELHKELFPSCTWNGSSILPEK